MRTAKVFEGVDETLWARLDVESVIRVDSGRRGPEFVVEVELGVGVDPRAILVLREERALTLSWSEGRGVLCRIPLEVPVGRPVLSLGPGRLLVRAPLLGPAPVSITPHLRPRARSRRLRAALGWLADRFRGLFAGEEASIGAGRRG